jgi:hypothetical protein
MTNFPGSQHLIKGAIVGIDKFNWLASVILFQYNPDARSRASCRRRRRIGGRRMSVGKFTCVLERYWRQVMVTLREANREVNGS